MPLDGPARNFAFAHLIASKVGYRLEAPGQSALATTPDGKRALLRWARDIKETVEIPRQQAKNLFEVLFAVGDGTGIIYEIFRLKRADLDKVKKDGSRPTVFSVSLKDASESLEMVDNMQVTERQVDEAWKRLTG